MSDQSEPKKRVCPQCREGRLIIHEFAEFVKSFDISDGSVLGSTVGDAIRVELQCMRCDYQWTPRGIVQAADFETDRWK